MEGALVATARFVADKASILFQLDEKLKALTGIEEKMEQLKELSTIIDMVIQDVDSRPLIDDVAKNLLRKLKYLAYDLEDVVDYYDTETSRKQRSSASFEQVRDFFSSDNQLVFRNTMSGMIKAVTESLDSILLQNSILLNFSQPSIRMSELSLHRATHSRNSFDVIGRETEKNMIVDMLTDAKTDNDTLKVIAIVGMGGLGKTTLAQLVFNDKSVKEYFASSRMWTVVGAEFDPTKIMKSVLELATEKPVKISEIDLVRRNLDKALSGKRFLLVLDDVWNEDASNWGIVKAALTCGARGSKILVTTRSLQVSSIMGSFNTHQIQELSRDDCLSLVKQFAFGDEAADQKLMEIGGKIVEKCGGVPLAAISLGSMLHSTRDEIYWSSVLNSEIWQLRDDEQKMLAILKLSYNTLPLQSKKCFAFTSLFSKNYTMAKVELITLWIANGLVRSEGNFDAETLGNRVFNDLVLRSFFSLVPSQGVTECRMHDLMHDLARSVSADEYWNSKQVLVNDIGNRTYHLRIYPENFSSKWENVAVPDFFENISSNTLLVLGEKPLYLRTLILRNCRFNQNAVLSKLKFLRVLDLSDNSIKELPTSIGNLIHLRYLNLSGNKIEVLPESITLLLNLQYLYCDDNLRHMPCGLSRLINLRCLPVFIAGKVCSITELEDLKLHGEMAIKFCENFTNYSCGGRQILKNKHLDQLRLQFNRSKRNDKDVLDDLCPNTSLKKLTIWNYGSQQFPAWLMKSQLPNLVEVSLKRCDRCEHIPAFGNLQFLKKLDLEFMNDIIHLDDEFHGRRGFPSLQELLLRGMDNLEKWSVSQGDDRLFPSLQRLRISSCPNLKCMPRFSRIQELEISHFSGSLLSSVGRLTSLSVLKLHNMYDMTSVPSGEVTLENCRDCEHIPPFGNLQLLKKLVLDSLRGITQMGSEFHGDGGFPSLQELYLSKMFNLEEWSEASESHGADQLFPALQCLRIFSCPKLKCMPRFPRIQKLEISFFSGSLLSSVGRLTSLSVLKLQNMDDMTSVPSDEVSLENCSDCEHILPFGNLQLLKELFLDSMGGITQMCSELHGNGGFPSLQQLYLYRMLNLEEWSESAGADQLFPSLQWLRISNCPILKCMPRFPRIQKLEISHCSESLLSSVGRLTSLAVLEVESMDDMTSVPSGCIRNLTSLTELQITECRELQSLPGDEMHHLKLIRSLSIVRCGSLASFPSDVGRLDSLCFLRLTRCPNITLQPKILVEILNSLRNFHIEICRKKVNLCGQFQNLHTVKELHIIGSHILNIYPLDYGRETAKLEFCCCDGIEWSMTGEPASSVEKLYLYRIFKLTALPDWLKHLQSLRLLSIEQCLVLETLPRGLKNLSMLKTLRIIRCPQLYRRCIRGTGEYWPIIEHVPDYVLL